MSSDQVSGEVSALDYQLCGYQNSRLQYRGPTCDLDQSYIAALGGSETFGRYVRAPFPALLETRLGKPVANLGVSQAGLSLFSEERWLLDAASAAELTVLQVLGAQNMSNRLYSVHSRRNDRFLAVSPALREMFPGVDFSEINFTGHLLTTLSRHSAAAFDVLVEELRWSWIQRMRRIVRIISGDVVLLWMSDRSPDDPADMTIGHEPAFVDRAMLDALSSDIAGLVEVDSTDDPPATRKAGKFFAEGEEDAALAYPGAVQHERAAKTLAKVIAEVRNARPRDGHEAGRIA